MIGVLIGIVVGAIVTFASSRYYYIRSGEDLKREAGSLREESQYLGKLVDILVSALQNEGLIQGVRRNSESGRIEGLDVTIRFAHASGEGRAAATPEINDTPQA